MTKHVVRVVPVWMYIVACSGVCTPQSLAAESELPFQQQVEVYCSEEGDVRVFRLRLEQPFLAEEFEKSNYLRLKSTDKRAYLIYPKETKFQQKNAEFYGRLRGEGDVTLRLSYEIVSENPDGSRRVEIREGDVPVSVPREAVGSDRIYREWAQRQNLYFARLLRYYPEATFYQYSLLQSKARYGVSPPPIPKQKPKSDQLETSLYRAFTGSLAIQESLQRETLSGVARVGDLTKHISTLKPPSLRSPPYETLLEKKRTEDQVEPKIHPIAKLVPHDQYLLQFNSLQPLSELVDLTTEWGDNLLRLFTVRSQDPQVPAKLADQLCVRWSPLIELFEGEVVGDVALTGADPYLLEGTDVTMILHLKQPEAFQQAAESWLAEVRSKYPRTLSQEFNYRGHKVVAHYTTDRAVSAFTVRHGDYAVYSNSHRAVRKVIDVAVELSPSLQTALDYQYVTTILPPSDAENAGYLFASEAFIKQLIGPAVKISQKRRLQCFNNLVMLNNASLFYRLEHGQSPRSLSDLIEGRFMDREKIVCPHGGAYAFDAEKDMCTCSLHNRLRYLTPNVELPVLQVSQQESAEYDRYKKRFESFWKTVFDPLAVRITVDSTVKLESCVLPFANGSMYRGLQQSVDKMPHEISTEKIAPSAITSMFMVPGRRNIGQFFGMIPGVAEVLRADPTLTDLAWLGDRFSIHFCDGETILQMDPTQFGSRDLPFIGSMSLQFQAMVGAAVAAVNAPVYVAVDIESREQAARLLEQLSQQVFLQQNRIGPGLDVQLDAYRLPDYKGHAIYVFSSRLYVLKVRLHVALVGDQLVAATEPEILREVIDASGSAEGGAQVEAHLMVRFNRRAVKRVHDDLQLYWAEKSRTACHRNIISIYSLCKLYDIPVEEVGQLSQAKYGVEYFCPDQGSYAFDANRDHVVCSVHGNREQSQQHLPSERDSAFDRFFHSLDEIVASLRFQEDALITTVNIVRAEDGEE